MRVEQLWRYPVKSLGGERVEAAEIGARSVAGDRHWALLDVEAGTVLTARRCPPLLFASAGSGGRGVTISLDDGSALGDDAALSAWLGRPVRLIEARPGERSTYETVVDFEHEATSDWVSWQGPEGSFHDSTRTQVSLLSAGALGPWDVRRFRANVVLDAGADAESLVGSRIRIGTAELDVVKQIDRCVVTTRPQPGLDRDLDVLRTINRDRGTFFGVGAMVVTPGRVAEGDPVEVVGAVDVVGP